VNYYLPLSIKLTSSDIRHHYDEQAELPAHEKVIRPMLSNCIEAFIYGLSDKSDLYKLNADILIKDKGKYKLDRNKECITGHEYLWNATTWKRGSIALILNKDFDFTDIFKNCYRPGLVATPNSGNSLSAVKKCKEESEKANIGICFSASNGIEWIQIYTDETHRDNLCELAYQHCLERLEI